MNKISFFEKYKKNLIFIVLLILAHSILFFTLQGKLLFTPDFGESDSYHFNLSTKYYLSQELKQNRLPFWTDKLSGGYPLIAEGQIGAFYIPNILFLKFLPFEVGYNMLFVFSFFMLSLGMYLFLKELRVYPLLAFLIAINFTLNGSITLRIVHLNLLQTICEIPILFYLYIRFLRSKSKKYLFLFPLVFSQMYFAGFPPMVFFFILGFLTVFGLSHFLKNRKEPIIYSKQILLLVVLIVVGLLISMPQILPSIELTQNSSRGLDLSYESLTNFPLQFKNILTFFSPFAFGNPKYGTYPTLSSTWGIFWENTPYVGRLFCLLSLISLIAYLLYAKRKQSPFLTSIIVVNLFLILIALGKNSPLYVLFYYPPFNTFRTLPRSLIIFNFLLFTFVGVTLNKFFNRKKLVKVAIILFLFVNALDLIIFAKNYHLFIDSRKVIQEPQIVKKIDSQYIYLTIGQPVEWNKVFLKTGWKDSKSTESYLFFKNFLFPNSNLLFGKRGYSINSPGLNLRRSDFIQYLIIDSLAPNDGKYVTTNDITSLLNTLGIKYIISNKEIIGNNNLKLEKLLSKNTSKIYLYQLNNSKFNMFYFPVSITKAGYLEDFQTRLLSREDLEKNAFSEVTQIEGAVNTIPPKVKTIKKDESDIQIQTTGSRQSILVFKKNFYPEWKAYIDTESTPIYKINFAHMGIVIPKGFHTIELRYENYSFKVGMLISLSSLVLFALFINKTNLKFFNRFKGAFD